MSHSATRTNVASTPTIMRPVSLGIAGDHISSEMDAMEVLLGKLGPSIEIHDDVALECTVSVHSLVKDTASSGSTRTHQSRSPLLCLVLAGETLRKSD